MSAGVASRMYGTFVYVLMWVSTVLASVLSGYIGSLLTNASPLGTIGFAIGGLALTVVMWMRMFFTFEG